jgi:hypothetical protein
MSIVSQLDQGGRVAPSSAADLRRRATGHALTLIGAYRACVRPELIKQIRSLDSAGQKWVLRADTQALRATFLPASPGTRIIPDWCK